MDNKYQRISFRIKHVYSDSHPDKALLFSFLQSTQKDKINIMMRRFVNSFFNQKNIHFTGNFNNNFYIVFLEKSVSFVLKDLKKEMQSFQMFFDEQTIYKSFEMEIKGEETTKVFIKIR